MSHSNSQLTYVTNLTLLTKKQPNYIDAPVSLPSSSKSFAHHCCIISNQAARMEMMTKSQV